MNRITYYIYRIHVHICKSSIKSMDMIVIRGSAVDGNREQIPEASNRCMISEKSASVRIVGY